MIALESSLWELTALEKHYHPAISTLAKSVGTEEDEDDKTPPMLEDFMVHTYVQSLFEQEKKQLGGNNNSSSGGVISGGKKGALGISYVCEARRTVYEENI